MNPNGKRKCPECCRREIAATEVRCFVCEAGHQYTGPIADEPITSPEND